MTIKWNDILKNLDSIDTGLHWALYELRNNNIVSTWERLKENKDKLFKLIKKMKEEMVLFGQ